MAGYPMSDRQRNATPPTPTLNRGTFIIKVAITADSGSPRGGTLRSTAITIRLGKDRDMILAPNMGIKEIRVPNFNPGACSTNLPTLVPLAYVLLRANDIGTSFIIILINAFNCRIIVSSIKPTNVYKIDNIT